MRVAPACATPVVSEKANRAPTPGRAAAYAAASPDGSARAAAPRPFPQELPRHG